MNKLNIVYLHAHDVGRYIQPYGYDVITPNLQSLAESGMLFRQAFCANPTCSPSRACLLTGQYAHENGMLGLAHRGFRLNDYQRTLPNFLRQHGWKTALSGIQHIAHSKYVSLSELGYDEFLDQAIEDGASGPQRIYSTGSEGVSQAAADFLARRHDRPFFLDVGFFPPHRMEDGSFPKEFEAPNPAYVRPPANIPDTDVTRQDFANFMASAQTFDAHLGKVIDAIDRNGLAQNTLIIATTDHGIPFPGMKCRLTDHGIGVMLILRGPGGFDSGKCSDSMVTHLDIFPTICQALDLKCPAYVSGEPLQLLTTEQDATLHSQIFAEVNVHAAYEPMRSVRTHRWKYIRHFEPRDHLILANCDNSPSKDYLFQSDWHTNAPFAEELYDLILDPMESTNLATESCCESTLNELRARVDKWMRDTNDPLLHGAIDLSDKIVTAFDAYSPAD
ncbi:sulfatase family protein [Cerasicoccus frondis]|uniref:sulfatase family protein n=1 Tax=Cerasicoccus frondis TaxID=490090 RepID=UPI002852494A|nr:sulfatase [Cerasicoccus frondis]